MCYCTPSIHTPFCGKPDCHPPAAPKPRERGDWMQTYSGVQLYPAAPEPHDFRIEDIARGLSHMCRFNGQIREFYSVAQHVVLCSWLAEEEDKPEALMHDNSEAYIADIVRPAKLSLPDYLNMEKGIEKAISQRFNLPHPMTARVKAIDNRMCVTEASQLMSNKAIRWWEDKSNPAYMEPFDIQIDPWTPEHARLAFLSEYDKLFNR